MRYLIPQGTRVTIRRPGAKPTDWFSYETKRELRFKSPVRTDRNSYSFEFQGWAINVAKKRVIAENRAVA